MILQKYTTININRPNFKDFEKLGYQNLKYRKPLKVKISDLLPNGDENFVNPTKMLKTKKEKYGDNFEKITIKIKNSVKKKYNVIMFFN